MSGLCPLLLDHAGERFNSPPGISIHVPICIRFRVKNKFFKKYEIISITYSLYPNPLGDANRHLKAHHIPQKLRFCGAPFVL